MNPYLKDRGNPRDYDPGPPKNRRWVRLFAETPNYRAIFKEVLGSDKTRWYFGPMFYRGRLKDHSVKVLLIGQEGAMDEALSHRAFTGTSGSYLQHFLKFIGITKSYLFLNTFVYSIKGQYTSSLRWLAQDPDSPIVRHRHGIFNYVLARNDLQLVMAVGNAAKESVVTWIQSRGGECPAGYADVSRCQANVLGPKVKIVGVMHPGGAGAGGNVGTIKSSYVNALQKIKQWMQDDPNWLPADSASPRFILQENFKYTKVPIPLHDFSFGSCLRLGRGGTVSIRKDNSRSIQIFSADGKRKISNTQLNFSYLAVGDREGYSDEPGDLPYEPPRKSYRDYDKGPDRTFARLFSGQKRGLGWPDFDSLGVQAHPSFGYGALFRGRPRQANVLILADQQSHDDLFIGRALCGESGQYLQNYLHAMGIEKSYLILRVFPFDTIGLSDQNIADIIQNPQIRKVYQAIVDKVLSANKNRLKLVLTFGRHAQNLSARLNFSALDVVHLKAWKESGVSDDWQAKLNQIAQIDFAKDLSHPSFVFYDQRGQIPRFDLPFGVPRFLGTSGDRASRPFYRSNGNDCYDYYRVFVPQWVFKLKPAPLSSKEKTLLASAPD